MSKPALISDIRSILSQSPSELTWQKLCAEVQRVKDQQQLESIILPYLLEHLQAWPDALRCLPPSFWSDVLEKKAISYGCLIRTFSLDGLAALGIHREQEMKDVCGQLFDSDVLDWSELTTIEGHVEHVSMLFSTPFVNQSFSQLSNIQIQGNPIISVHLTRLFLYPLWKRIRTLKISGYLGQVDFFARLRNKHLLQQLEDMDLSGTGLYARSFVTEVGTLKALRKLDLSSCSVNFDDLLKTDFLPRLDELRLLELIEDKNNLSRTSLPSFLQHPKALQVGNIITS